MLSEYFSIQVFANNTLENKLSFYKRLTNDEKKLLFASLEEIFTEDKGLKDLNTKMSNNPLWKLLTFEQKRQWYYNIACWHDYTEKPIKAGPGLLWQQQQDEMYQITLKYRNRKLGNLRVGGRYD